MSLSAEFRSATAILDPMGRNLVVTVQLIDSSLGNISPKTIYINDPVIFNQVVDVIETYLPDLSQRLGIPVTLPPDLVTANTAPGE